MNFATFRKNVYLGYIFVLAMLRQWLLTTSLARGLLAKLYMYDHYFANAVKICSIIGLGKTSNVTFDLTKLFAFTEYLTADDDIIKIDKYFTNDIHTISFIFGNLHQLIVQKNSETGILIFPFQSKKVDISVKGGYLVVDSLIDLIKDATEQKTNSH